MDEIIGDRKMNIYENQPLLNEGGMEDNEPEDMMMDDDINNEMIKKNTEE